MTLQRTRTIHKSLVVHTKSVVELGVVCMPGIPALRLGQEVGEFQANLGYIADSISKIAKQKSWVSEVGGLRSGLEAASGQGRPEILHRQSRSRSQRASWRGSQPCTVSEGR